MVLTCQNIYHCLSLKVYWELLLWCRTFDRIVGTYKKGKENVSN